MNPFKAIWQYFKTRRDEIRQAKAEARDRIERFKVKKDIAHHAKDIAMQKLAYICVINNLKIGDEFWAKQHKHNIIVQLAEGKCVYDESRDYIDPPNPLLDVRKIKQLALHFTRCCKNFDDAQKAYFAMIRWSDY